MMCMFGIEALKRELQFGKCINQLNGIFLTTVKNVNDCNKYNQFVLSHKASTNCMTLRKDYSVLKMTTCFLFTLEQAIKARYLKIVRENTFGNRYYHYKQMFRLVNNHRAPH